MKSDDITFSVNTADLVINSGLVQSQQTERAHTALIVRIASDEHDSQA